jgi:hypothetical protein
MTKQKTVKAIHTNPNSITGQWADNMLVQTGPNGEIIISLYQPDYPVILFKGDFESLESVNLICVAKVITNKEVARQFADAINQELKKEKSPAKQDEDHG